MPSFIPLSCLVVIVVVVNIVIVRLAHLASVRTQPLCWFLKVLDRSWEHFCMFLWKLGAILWRQFRPQANESVDLERTKSFFVASNDICFYFSG